MPPEVELARELLTDAETLLSQERYRSSISRAYYSAYHACIALMEDTGLTPINFLGRSGRPAGRWEHGIVTTVVASDPRLSAILGPAVARQVLWLYQQRIRGDYRPREAISALAARTGAHLAAQVVRGVEVRFDARRP